MIQDFEAEANSALQYVSSHVTSDPKKTVAFVTIKEDWVYFHTNHKIRGQNSSTKIATQMQSNGKPSISLFELFINAVCQVWPADSEKAALLDLHENEVTYFVHDPDKRLGVGFYVDAMNIEFVPR